MTKDIIFDLGGVIVDIDVEAFYAAFKLLDKNANEDFFTIEKQSNIVHEFETGKLTEDQFLANVLETVTVPASKDEIKAIWCKMIIGITKETIDCLKALKKTRNIYALSNTNIIHHRYIDKHLRMEHQIESLESLFSDIYMSYVGGQRKPDVECFLHALEQFSLKPQSTIFIDDINDNLNTAKLMGIDTVLKLRNESLSECLQRNNIF